MRAEVRWSGLLRITELKVEDKKIIHHLKP